MSRAPRSLLEAILFFAFLLNSAVHADPVQYLINPGDVLKIFVWNEESLSGEVVVRPDGAINFPMAGQIQAGGRTTAQVEASIVAGLAKYLRGEPVVTASLLRMDGNIVYVLGKVNDPGSFQVVSQIDVTQALALAGGLNSFADEDRIKVLRRNGSGEQMALPFNYSSVKNGKKLESNILLKSGDVIVVP